MVLNENRETRRILQVVGLDKSHYIIMRSSGAITLRKEITSVEALGKRTRAREEAKNFKIEQCSRLSLCQHWMYYFQSQKSKYTSLARL